MKLGKEVGLSPDYIVLDGDPASEVDVGPGHIVLGQDPAPLPPPERGTAAPPLFAPFLLWPNGRPSRLLLSICCTGHGRVSLYFTNGRPFPPL